MVEFTLDRKDFTVLGKPGKYKLSGTFFSNGLSSPSEYRRIGLTEADVQSLPFQILSGHISTNPLQFEVVHSKAQVPRR